MKRIAIVYGTRPELIKLVPLILKMQKHPLISLCIINTGQHIEMVEDVETAFNIKPDYNMDIMQHNQSLTDILINVAKGIETIIKNERFDLMIVQGDTSTASTVATVSFYNKLKIAHVEAGLRSFNIIEPFPEEFNRKLISLIASYNFAPTVTACNNLLKEGIPTGNIYLVGNTIVDMVKMLKDNPDYQQQGFNKKKILITAHRRENHGTGIKNICRAVKIIAQKYPGIIFTWPVHPNPNVLEIVTKELQHIKEVTLTKPLSYLQLTKELNESFMVWTDSGGIQEECPSFQKPVLILRNVTERPEVVDAGFGIIVGSDTEKIVQAAIGLLENDSLYKAMTSGKNPFGDGNTCETIIKILTAV